MLISSKSQIDYGGGYVGGFATRGYMEFIEKMRRRYPRSRVKICRDHCGPGFNGRYDLDDCYRTIRTDIQCGFDLIHVDFCHFPGTKAEILAQSRTAIDLCLSLNPDVELEIGTDENVGASLNWKELDRLRLDIGYFLGFCRPRYYVVQTGSLTKETRQVGTYNREFVEAAAAMLHDSGVRLKEHNADYLSAAALNARAGHVDAMNIAPQIGVIQTSVVLNQCLAYGIDASPYLEVCYRGGKWRKWLLKDRPEDKTLCSLIAGHYHFMSDEYRRLVDSLSKLEDIEETILLNITKVISHYANCQEAVG
ncbi:hypothetical protein BE20_56730 [Sorangium cellulosum]|uniref:Xylose isomerase-like TIM barrel domain-containing protein n=1 Tax=Sorangium cellulosum TaxID=56 RepID=A0A150R6C0_SORCE|nr:hypothetical protein BE18_18380 [Sorangium cellulosum]KYG00141.1 hypothetical protein BE20_56730 [Sorangium cellulosum]